MNALGWGAMVLGDDRRLEVDHGDVRPGHEVGQGGEQTDGIVGETARQRPGKVDVSGEDQPNGRPVRRGDRCGLRWRRSGQGRRGGTVLTGCPGRTGFTGLRWGISPREGGAGRVSEGHAGQRIQRTVRGGERHGQAPHLEGKVIGRTDQQDLQAEKHHRPADNLAATHSHEG